MSSILIGTASWTDKSLIASGRFYPPKRNTPEERLRYYSSQFPLVEVDSSYYALPKPEVAELWAKRTPPDFGLYDLKGKAATDMFRAGVPLERIQHLLGHASIKTTEIYVKARLPDLVAPTARPLIRPPVGEAK